LLKGSVKILMSKIYQFSPSEFAFGYSGCKRCYYDLKINNIRIQTGFPSIFAKLDSLQKKFYHNKSSIILNSNKILPGIIKTDYSKLQTSKVLNDEKGRHFQLRGKIDAYVDHTNFFSIIDFKVTKLNEKKIDTYKTQLMSYALMFEKPDDKSLRLSPIKNLGIFCFEPSELIEIKKDPFFKMSTMYFDIKRDDKYFIKFITNILDFLEGDKPDFTSGCSFCDLKRNDFF
tara:strand:- start:102 stop:791 length:690 start_codon:yes stop_codon:yes gene_type:complete